MKIYIWADQEGVAGVYSRREKYLYATEYATMELVAICEALLSQGVDGILLNSVHIIEYHKFPAQVRILHGLPQRNSFSEGLDATCDAVMIAGMHAMAGGREKGCWRHTRLPHPISRAYSAVEEARLNGDLIGEFGLVTAFAGIHGVPVALVTGDHWACLEAQELLPNVETVAVKEGISYHSAISMTPQAAAQASAEGAKRALAKLDRISPWVIEGEATLQVRYLFSERAADAMAGVHGARRVDERTVAITYPDITALRDGMGCLRAPELDVYAQDMDLAQVTGLFTRLGGEPYEPAPTYPPPRR